MHGSAKVPGSSLTKTCFFFQTTKIMLQKNSRPIICRLICCRLSCHILEMFLRAFLKIFDLRLPTFSNFTYFGKNILRQKIFGQFFNRLNDLFLGSFKINTISALPSAFLELVLAISFSFGKFLHFLQKFQFFSRNLSRFSTKKEYQLKDCVFLCVPAFFLRASLPRVLDPSVYNLLFSKTTSLKYEFFVSMERTVLKSSRA